MAHYFDDVFQRGSRHSRRPSGPEKPRLRRSSTARSIGARSDFDSVTNEDDEDARSMSNSVFPEDPERFKEKEEADTHMHRYISDQLNRYRDEDLNASVPDADELEPKAS